MRLATVRQNGKIGLGLAAEGGKMRVLLEGDGGYPGSLDDLVARGAIASPGDLAALQDAPEIDEAKLEFLPPLSRGKFLCSGLNYAGHAEESGLPIPEHPVIFARFPSSLIGHGQNLLKPRVSEKFDYEGELVAVIGKGGKYISEEDALDHVIGYMAFNDGSIRDYQLRTPQWTMGKNFDETGALGPWLVTADELPAGASGLRLQTRVNGRTVQDSNTGDLIFNVAKLVSSLSEGITLAPGDMIATGTPSGVGLSYEPPLLLGDGDVCEVEIEGLGILRNPVVAEV